MARSFDAQGNIVDGSGKIVVPAKSGIIKSADNQLKTPPTEAGVYDIAKGFVKNLPTNIARGYGGSQNEFAARALQTVYDKAGIKRGSTAEKIADAAVNATGFAGLAVPVKNITRDKDLVLPLQDQPLIKQSKSFESASDFAGSLGEAALDTALLGTFGAGSVAKAAAKEALKEGGEQAVKTAAKPLIKRVGSYLAKEGLKDTAVGGAYGLATELQNPDYTPESLLTSAGTGAAAGLILPPAMGKTLDLGISGSRAIGKAIKKTGTEAAESLTKYGTVPSNNIWDRVEIGARPVEQTGLQKAAVKTAGAITKAVELPRKIARMTDRFAPINFFQKDWTENGVTTKDDLADNFQAAPYKARAEAISRAENYVDTALSFGDDWQDVKDYSQLLDLKDRLARGNPIVGGKSITDVNAGLATIEQRLGPEKAQKLTQGVEYIQKFLSDELDKSVESGRLSQESAAAFRAAHPNYLPHVVLDFIDSEAGGTAPKGAVIPEAGKSYNMADSGFKKAEGSERDIMDLDDAVGKKLLENAMKNEKNKAIAPLVEYGEKTGVFKRFEDAGEKSVDYKKEGLDKISYYKNGVREDWLVPADLAEAIKHGGSDVTNAWTKINAWLDTSLLGKAITKPASFVRAVSTTFNPVFSLISNPLRDIQTTQLTSDVKYRDIVHGLLNAVSGGRYDKKLTEEFLKSGASQASLYREVQSPQDIVKKMMKDKQNAKLSNIIGKTLVNTKNLVPTIGEKMEQASRMAVFRRGLLDGLTPQQAAKQARDASVDFGKAGDVTSTINRVIPFFNARIQGAINLKNAATKDPYRFARKMFYTAIYPTMVLNSYNSRFSSYENIPDSDKRKYWIIMYGQTPGVGYDGKRIMIPLYVALPKGEAQQGMSSVVDRILKTGKEKYPESATAFLGNLVKDFSPINESSLLPTVIQMPVELYTNKSFYRGTQIEPDYIPVPKNEKEFTKKSVKAETVDPGLRATKSTSVVANELGKLLNWSPSKIDYVIRTGALNDIILGIDFATDKPSRKLLTEEEKPSQTPFVRSILRSAAYGVQQKKKEAEKTKAREKNTKLFEKRLSRPPREQK